MSVLLQHDYLGRVVTVLYLIAGAELVVFGLLKTNIVIWHNKVIQRYFPTCFEWSESIQPTATAYAA
jgi:hypothetical protein